MGKECAGVHRRHRSARISPPRVPKACNSSRSRAQGKSGPRTHDNLASVMFALHKNLSLQCPSLQRRRSYCFHSRATAVRTCGYRLCEHGHRPGPRLPMPPLPQLRGGCEHTEHSLSTRFVCLFVLMHETLITSQGGNSRERLNGLWVTTTQGRVVTAAG